MVAKRIPRADRKFDIRNDFENGIMRLIKQRKIKLEVISKDLQERWGLELTKPKTKKEVLFMKRLRKTN